MLTIELTDQQKQELLVLHKKTRDKRICDRIKAVIHKSNGWSNRHIAEALLIHEDTVAQHLFDYQRDKLKPQNGGSQPKLNAEQTKQLLEHVDDNIYLSVHPIIEHISQTYQINYSGSGIRRLLKQNGFSYKKPMGIPQKIDRQAQAKFIEQYNELKQQTDSDKEPIIFIDASHPNCATKLNCGWMKKGASHTKYVKTTASRSRVNLIAGVNLKAIEKTQVAMVDTVNGDAVIDYLISLKKQYKDAHTLHIILDQAGYHRSEAFKLQVKLLGGIKLHYLPPYSPNLNPTERFWKVMNEAVRDNQFFKNVTYLKSALKQFFEVRLPDMAESLNSRLTDSFQVFPEPSS